MQKTETTDNVAASYRFLKRQHIRGGRDFARAYARRCSVSDGAIVVVGCENGLDFARLGLSVSRKVGGAVVRNRWKRLIREAFRLSQHNLPGGIDLVVIPRAGGDEPELSVLEKSLPRLAAELSRKLARTRK